jgi:hypothetical protein
MSIVFIFFLNLIVLLLLVLAVFLCRPAVAGCQDGSCLACNRTQSARYGTSS